jgi:hypothetical protein
MTTGKTAEITDHVIAEQFRWYDPERIILFGSFARREPAEWERMIEEERGFILRILLECREIYARPGG